MRSGSSIPRGTHAARARTGRIADCHPADSPLSPPGTPDLPNDMRTRGGRQARTGVPGRTAGGLTVRKAHVGQVDSYGRDGQGAWRPVAPAGDRTVTTPGTTGATERDRARGSSPATADGAGSDRSPPDPPRSRSARGAPPGRTGEHVDTEAAPHQLRPMIVRRRGTHGTAGGLFRGVSRNPGGFRIGMDGEFPGRDEPQDRTGPRGHATRRAAPTPRDTGPSGRGVSAAGRAADRAVRTVRAGGRRAAGRRCQRAAPAALPTTPSTRQVALAMPLAEAPWAVDEEEPHSTSKHISSGAPAVDAGDAATEPLRARQDAGEHPQDLGSVRVPEGYATEARWHGRQEARTMTTESPGDEGAERTAG